MLERLARAATGRPAVTLGIVLALALGGGALALRLQPNTATDTFVNSSVVELSRPARTTISTSAATRW